MDDRGEAYASGIVVPRSRLRLAMDLTLILSGSIFTGLLTIAMAPVVPRLTEHFGGHTDARLLAQMIMVLPCIGVIVGGPVMGWIIDRHGTRNVLLFSTALYAACGMVGLFTTSLTLLIGSRLVLGIMGSGIYASTFALAGERFAGAKRASIIGFKGAVGGGGATFAVLAAGSIAQHWGWRAVFCLYLLAIPAFLLALGLERAPKREAGPRPVASARPLFAMWSTFLMMTLIFAATFSTIAQGGFLLAADGVHRADIAAVVMACASGCYMLSSACYGFVRSRFGAQWTFRAGLILIGLGAIGAALVTGTLVTGICFAIFGFGNGMTAPYLHNLVLERAPADVRGRAAGLVSPTHYAGEFLNPPIFQLLLLLGGVKAGFAAVGAMILTAAVLLRPERWRTQKSLDTGESVA